MSIDLRSVLAFGNALQRATGLRDLIEVAHDGVREQTRYRNVWLAAAADANPGPFRHAPTPSHKGRLSVHAL